MKILLMLLIVVSFYGCKGSTYVVQQGDGTYVAATFVEANAPRVKASLSTSVCPEGTHAVGETSGYVSHEASLDTDRGRRGGYYDRYSGYYEPSIRVQQAVGGRKVFTCVPDAKHKKEEKK